MSNSLLEHYRVFKRERVFKRRYSVFRIRLFEAMFRTDWSCSIFSHFFVGCSKSPWVVVFSKESSHNVIVASGKKPVMFALKSVCKLHEINIILNNMMSSTTRVNKKICMLRERNVWNQIRRLVRAVWLLTDLKSLSTLKKGPFVWTKKLKIFHQRSCFFKKT